MLVYALTIDFRGSQVDSKTKISNFRVIDGEKAYVGTERRLERRREQSHERVERLLKNFGLDRRLSTDRRRKDTSWFLTSSRAVSM